jgi:uncharacterized membrane protein YfcA
VNLPDIINGLFEMSGGFFLLLSVRQIMRDKIVRGISWLHVGFFSVWGIWNIYYYYNLAQWFSWVCGNLAVLHQLPVFVPPDLLLKEREA